MRQTLLGMVLLGSTVVALADQQDNRRDRVHDERSSAQVERSRYDNRAERRENTVHTGGDEHRPGRLSLDERRELRRQINEVGQDIYRPRR